LGRSLKNAGDGENMKTLTAPANTSWTKARTNGKQQFELRRSLGIPRPLFSTLADVSERSLASCRCPNSRRSAIHFSLTVVFFFISHSQALHFHTRAFRSQAFPLLHAQHLQAHLP